MDGNGGHRLDGHTGGRVLAGALVRGAVVARVDAKDCREKMGKWKKWKVIERGQLATGKLLMFII